MTDRLKKYIENNINKIEDREFDTLYEECPINLRGELTTTLYVANIDILYDLTRIYSRMFDGVDCVDEIVIPESIKIIEDDGFSGCLSLTHVSLPEGMVQLPMNCFSYCQSLTSVVLPSTIKKIGENCFAYTDLDCIDYRGTVEQFKRTGLNTKVRWKQYSPLIRSSARIQCIDGVI